ncbi:HD domain-containing protein [Methylobacterium sp. JK268]
MRQADGLVAKHLRNGGRAAHSRVVGCLMRSLAGGFDGDPDLWDVVGLCHDLDYYVTEHDRTRHGLVTAAWLSGDLPAEALLAIAAHDPRTGTRCRTMLADALRLADSFAVVDAVMGRAATVALGRSGDPLDLATRLAARPYLVGTILQTSNRHGVPVAVLAQACAQAPLQE